MGPGSRGRDRRREQGRHLRVQERPAAYAESPRPLRRDGPAGHGRSLISGDRNVVAKVVAGRSERRESEQSSAARSRGARESRPHVRRAGCRVARLTGNGMFPQSLTRRYDVVDAAWACIAAVIVGSRAASASGESAGGGRRRCTHPADAEVWAVIAPGARTKRSEGCTISATEGRRDGGPSRLRDRLGRNIRAESPHHQWPASGGPIAINLIAGANLRNPGVAQSREPVS